MFHRQISVSLLWIMILCWWLAWEGSGNINACVCIDPCIWRLPIIQPLLSTMTRSKRTWRQTAQSSPKSQPQLVVPQELALLPPISPPLCTRWGQQGQQDLCSTESLDFSNLSDTLSNDRSELPGGQAVLPSLPSPAGVVPATGPSGASPRPASPGLLAPPPARVPRNFADDIVYFFNRSSKVKGTMTICKCCG